MTTEVNEIRAHFKTASRDRILSYPSGDYTSKHRLNYIDVGLRTLLQAKQHELRELRNQNQCFPYLVVFLNSMGGQDLIETTQWHKKHETQTHDLLSG